MTVEMSTTHVTVRSNLAIDLKSTVLGKEFQTLTTLSAKKIRRTHCAVRLIFLITIFREYSRKKT